MKELILVLMLNLCLFGCNFDFFGGYLVVTAHYLVVTAGYCLLPAGYCWWLLLVPTFSMNGPNP